MAFIENTMRGESRSRPWEGRLQAMAQGVDSEAEVSAKAYPAAQEGGMLTSSFTFAHRLRATTTIRRSSSPLRRRSNGRPWRSWRLRSSSPTAWHGRWRTSWRQSLFSTSS